jgi:hypothetical protein
MIPHVKILSLTAKPASDGFYWITYRNTKVLRVDQVKLHRDNRLNIIRRWLDANTTGVCEVGNNFVRFKDYDEALLFYMTFK